MIPSSTEGLYAFDLLLFDACALLRPPEHLDADEWADKYFYLSAEGSSQPGKWYTSSAEYQRGPLRAISDTCHQSIVLMWGSQIGKTAIGLIATGFFADHDPCPQIMVQPTEDMAKAVNKDRIGPMIRDTPRLRSLFGKNTTGEEWNNKSYPGGQLTMAWANSPAQLASRPKRFAWTDEEGRYKQNAEGDPVDQVRKRLATYKNRRKHLRTSSPALRKTCRITKAYDNSDQQRYYVPCPDCGHMQTLRWSNIKWIRTSLEPDNFQLEDVWYVCEACEYHIHESDKYAMIRAGEWRADNPGGGDGKTAGFHLNSLYSPIGYEWEEIVQDYLKCLGIPDKLQVFTNTVLAEAWDEQAEGADMNAIQKRAEDYDAEAPEWAIIFTCGADVQPDRIEATKWGWGVNDVCGVIEHRVFFGATSNHRSGAWVEFDAWRNTRVEHKSGLMLPIACTFVDSGDGNRTQTVYEYVRWCEQRGAKVFACKGSSQTAAPVVSDAKRAGKIGALLVNVGTDTAKDTLFSRLEIIDPTRPGYVHFPRHHESGCNSDYFSHLTAEARVTHDTKGGQVSRWEKQRPRNEALDCWVYAYAAKEFMRPSMRGLAAKLAARVEALRAEGRLPVPTWAARVAQSAVALHTVLSSLSPASSAASPSPRPIRRPKKRKRLPGFNWIRGR